MTRIWLCSALALTLFLLMTPQGVKAQIDDRIQIVPDRPTLTVSGQGEVSVAPDQATLRLGATVQAQEAQEAQSQVNRIVQDAIDDIKDVGIPEEQIRTHGLSLFPVYSEPRRDRRGDPGDGGFEPEIVAYRASNVVEVRIDQLDLVGEVIDAGVQAGANEVQGIEFSLKDDTQARSDALRQAVKNARSKAQAIAEAMGVTLGQVWTIEESSGPVVPMYRHQMARAEMAMADTPVEPGQLQITATVQVRWRLAGGDEAAEQPAAPVLKLGGSRLEEEIEPEALEVEAGEEVRQPQDRPARPRRGR